MTDFAERYPHLVGHSSTHYPECFKDHPGCAYMLGRADAEAEVSEWIARYVAENDNKPVEERTSDEQE